MKDFIKDRVEALYRILRKENRLPFLFSKRENVYYITSFSSTNAYVLFTHSDVFVFTDGRYIEKARKSLDSSIFNVCGIKRSLFPHLRKLRLRRLFIEDSSPYNFYKALSDHLFIKVVPIRSPILSLRIKKGEKELDNIEKAVSIIEKVFLDIEKCLKIGITEVDVYREIECKIREYGGEGASFPPIVLFGENSSLPHGAPTDRRLKEGDIVLIDAGCFYNGYASDMTRTFIFKPASGDLERWSRIYNLVLKAKRLGEEKILEFMDTRKVDVAVNGFFREHGLNDKYLHSLGHGVGLEIHEEPYLSRKRRGVKLEDGMVFTIEPGIYLEGEGGIRIEDMYVLEKNNIRKLQKLVPYNFVID